MQAMTIGKLATAADVNFETVRYYERISLMFAPSRTANGHRVYEEEHLRRLIFIRRTREHGFSFEDIRALLALAGPAGNSCAGVREIAEKRLEGVRRKIADLSKLEAALSQNVSRCTGNPASFCHLLDVLSALRQDNVESF